MTGYQEILSDPSYAGQIVCFTFPHIGIVGTNDEDIESINPAVRGLIVRADAAHPSNWRSLATLDRWLKRHNIPAISGIDTRALASRIREKGMPHGVDRAWRRATSEALRRRRQGVRGPGRPGPRQGGERPPDAQMAPDAVGAGAMAMASRPRPRFRAVVIDYGVKRNILRELAGLGADVTVVPATASFDEVMAHKPHGVVLSNGPGDPAATGEYAIPTIKALIEAKVPVFGICLGHQMLGLALGGKTKKMTQGHHGANHPVKDLETGKVEIVSMNHGFTVDADSLPKGVKQTHVSLFDGTNCGLRVDGQATCSACSTTPKPRPARWIRTTCSSASRQRRRRGLRADCYRLELQSTCHGPRMRATQVTSVALFEGTRGDAEFVEDKIDSASPASPRVSPR